MTVKELITLLEKCSPDKEVAFPELVYVESIIEYSDLVVLKENVIPQE